MTERMTTTYSMWRRLDGDMTTRPSNAKCHWDKCRAPRSEHAGDEQHCPRGGKQYKPPPLTRRGSASLTEYEARVIELMCKAALAGRRYEPGPSQVKTIGGVMRKMDTVRRRVVLIDEIHKRAAAELSKGKPAEEKP